MSKEPLISVIIPVYRVERFLSRCIDSVIGQTYKNLEIILVTMEARIAAGISAMNMHVRIRESR